MMKTFLQTRSGLLNGASIDMITPYRSDPDTRHFEIDYHHGREPKTTYATADDVQDYLDSLDGL